MSDFQIRFSLNVGLLAHGRREEQGIALLSTTLEVREHLTLSAIAPNASVVGGGGGGGRRRLCTLH